MDIITFILKMLKFGALLALIGAANAMMSCEDCQIISKLVSAGAVSDEAIRAELEIIWDPVCSHVQDVESCHEHLPNFWAKIAVALFDAEHGWFSARHICHQQCAAKTLSARPACHDCQHMLGQSVHHMADEQAIQNTIHGFDNSHFCHDFEDHQACRDAYHHVLPPAMHALSRSGDQWIDKFCADDAGCSDQ